MPYSSPRMRDRSMGDKRRVFGRIGEKVWYAGAWRVFGECLMCERKPIPILSRGCCSSCYTHYDKSVLPSEHEDVLKRVEWTPKRLETVRYLREVRGMNSTQIAKELGLTKDQIKRAYRKLKGIR